MRSWPRFVLCPVAAPAAFRCMPMILSRPHALNENALYNVLESIFSVPYKLIIDYGGLGWPKDEH